MDMLSRYLYAVSNDLPKKAVRDDIIAEIADDLQSQIEERESVLGRPLTDDEEATVIRVSSLDVTRPCPILSAPMSYRSISTPCGSC
jgi:hypothetical protein